MDLHHRLRQVTQHLHDELEKTFLLKKLMANSVTFNDYRLVLKKFYGFVVPCELLINKLSYQAIFSKREKTSLLEQDLSVLGIPRSSHGLIPCCNHLPYFSKPVQVLGYLYVMEGSTLGGQIITQHLKNQLKLTDSAIKFFNGYGKNTKMMWNELCQILNAINDSTQQNDIINAAISTYNSLYQWLTYDV